MAGVANQGVQVPRHEFRVLEGPEGREHVEIQVQLTGVHAVSDITVRIEPPDTVHVDVPYRYNLQLRLAVPIAPTAEAVKYKSKTGKLTMNCRVITREEAEQAAAENAEAEAQRGRQEAAAAAAAEAEQQRQREAEAQRERQKAEAAAAAVEAEQVRQQQQRLQKEAAASATAAATQQRSKQKVATAAAAAAATQEQQQRQQEQQHQPGASSSTSTSSRHALQATQQQQQWERRADILKVILNQDEDLYTAMMDAVRGNTHASNPVGWWCKAFDMICYCLLVVCCLVEHWLADMDTNGKPPLAVLRWCVNTCMFVMLLMPLLLLFCWKLAWSFPGLLVRSFVAALISGPTPPASQQSILSQSALGQLS